MNILVTGSSGFLGKSLSKKLKIFSPNELVLLDSAIADLTVPGSLDKFNNIKFEKIIHLACWTQAGDFCLKFPGDQWIINQLINTNIVNWWFSNQRQAKFISIGTSCTYPEMGSYKEEEYFEGLPTKSLFTYAMTKRMLQNGIESLSKQYNLNYCTYVPSTLYGPGYKLNDKIPHFIFDLIKKFILFKKKNKEIVLWGDGSQIRELIYIDDFINHMIEIEKMGISNEIFNIGAGVGHSIREFATIISDILNINTNNIYYDTNAYVGTKKKVLNIEKISKLTNLHQKPLYEGIKIVIDDLWDHIE